MKRIVALLVVIVMVFGVVVSAVAGLLANRVEQEDLIFVTWPISMLTEDADNFNEVTFIAQNDGYESIEINDDGTVTLGLDPRLHQMIEDQMFTHFDTVFQSLVESEDTPYIKEISYEKNLKEMYVLVDSLIYQEAKEENYQNIVILGYYILEYHSLLGYDLESMITIKDFESEAEIDTIAVPNDLGL